MTFSRNTSLALPRSNYWKNGSVTQSAWVSDRTNHIAPFCFRQSGFWDTASANQRARFARLSAFAWEGQIVGSVRIEENVFDVP
jgi:hypothetical protein